MPFYFRLCLSTLAVVRHVGAVIEDDFEIVEPAMAAVDGSAEGMVGEADRRETGAEGETVESVDKMDETGGDKGKEGMWDVIESVFFGWYHSQLYRYTGLRSVARALSQSLHTYIHTYIHTDR